jgi:hypothetical protein
MANKLVKLATTNAWDAGAVSASARSAELVASLTFVAGSAGVIAGLAPALSNPSSTSVEHGFLAQAGMPLRVIEGGTVVASSGIQFSGDITVSIYRVGSTVYYVAGDWNYTSAIPSVGARALQTVLYSPGDAVDSPAISVYSQDIGNAGMSSTLTLSDEYGYGGVLYGDLSSDLSLSSEAGGGIYIVAGMESTLVLLDGGGASVEIVAGMQSILRLSSESGVDALAFLQYATNLLTGAVTRYVGFEFDGFCRVGMETYAFRSDGLYRIGGSSDAGQPINMLIDFADEDLGTTQAKRVGNVFLGLETDGDVVVRMTGDDEHEGSYRAYKRRSEFRADLARGVKSRHWNMRLEVTQATGAQLDNIEWVVSANGRRT